MDMKSEQIGICKKYDAIWVESPDTFKVGIAANVQSGKQPLNGLRHPPEGDTTGWYIWAGEEPPQTDPDYFLPLHVSHLHDWCPQALKYLGLPPGYRFLISDDGYEDVWFDEQLLAIGRSNSD